MVEKDLLSLRVDLAKRSKWNIGYFASGCFFWIFVGFVTNNYSVEKSRIYLVLGTFFIFPMALLLSKIFKADPFSTKNTLGKLIGITHMCVVFFSLPLVVLTAMTEPNSLILVMAVLYCLDFYVMAWSFGTWIFTAHAILRIIIVTLIYMVFPAYIFTIIPFSIAFLYLITIIFSQILRKRWINNQVNNLK
ncbi:DUF7010 family protein [Fulvivirga lutea]|uniref:Uncharacterized protein n=1 Tax=Fulvivirga lutea TaxID=2810512 RepID=A0A974WLX7_9BACT|nr:hypothetical protein [Fulvivirga lutea]QSE98660.1 hypothetical protein JR347_06160 [Fulvivirga lutea]